MGDLESVVDTYTQVEVESDNLRSENTQLVKEKESAELKLVELIQKLNEEITALKLNASKQESKIKEYLDLNLKQVINLKIL